MHPALTTSLGDCEAVVNDTAGVLTAGQLNTVTARAEQLRSDTGLEIRVRILTQDDAPQLESWVDQQQAFCDSWHGAEGGFRSNLIVLALTTDTDEQTGETGLYVGDAVPDALDEAELQHIRVDVINPALSDGDYTRGIIAGLDAIDENINPGFPTGLLIFLILLVVAVLGLALYLILRHRRRAADRRRALMDRLGVATGASDALVLQMDEVAERLDLDVALVPSVLAPEEAAELTAPTGPVRDKYAAVTTTRGDLSNGRDVLYRETDLTKVGPVVDAWEQLQKDSADVLPQLVAEETRLSSALTNAQSVPTRLGAIDGQVADIQALATSARAQGFVIDGDVAVLATVPEAVRRVQALVTAKRLMAAGAELDRLDAAMQTAKDALGSLAQRAADLQGRADSLARERVDLEQLGTTAAGAEDELHSRFPGVERVDEQSVATARTSLAGSDAALASARASLQSHDLASASEAIDQAAATMAAARTSFQDASARLARARQLSADLPVRLDRDRRVLEQIEAQRPYLPNGGAAFAPALDWIRAALAAISPGAAPDWVRLDADLSATEAKLEAVRQGVEGAVQTEQARAEEIRLRQAPSVAFVGGRRRSGWIGGGGVRIRTGGGRRWSGGGGGSSSRGSSGGGRSGGSSGRSSGGRSGGSSRR